MACLNRFSTEGFGDQKPGRSEALKRRLCVSESANQAWAAGRSGLNHAWQGINPQQRLLPSVSSVMWSSILMPFSMSVRSGLDAVSAAYARRWSGWRSAGKKLFSIRKLTRSPAGFSKRRSSFMNWCGFLWFTLMKAAFQKTCQEYSAIVFQSLNSLKNCLNANA